MHKNAADRHQLSASREKTANLRNAKGFYEWMQQHRLKFTKDYFCKKGKGLYRRIVHYIGCGDITRNIRKCSKTGGLKGIKKLHCLRDIGEPGKLVVRRASCHRCKACVSWDHTQECEHLKRTGVWKKKTMSMAPVNLDITPQERAAALLARAKTVVEDAKVHGGLLCD